MEVEGRGDDFRQLYERKEEQQVELIEWIIQDRNIDEAIKAVKRNKGAAGGGGRDHTFNIKSAFTEEAAE